MRKAAARARKAVARGLIPAALVALASVARADDDGVLHRRMWFAERGDKLAVSTAFTELLDEKAYERLSSGFATTVAARIYVYKKDRDLPVSMVMASLRAVYDLWDEVYVVRIDGPQGRETRRYEHRADALKALTTLDSCPIAPLSRIPRGPHHYMAMVVELNPVSKELKAEMRRWLTKPAGSASLDRSSSFFGSFVSVFVNPRIPEADRVLKLRSQPFYRVKE
jgi:hypothetical protein